MIGPAVKKYAMTKGWKITKDVAYGYINGYMVTLVDGWDIKKAAFSCELTDETKEILAKVLSDKIFRRNYKIIDFYYEVSGIIIVFDDTFFAMKKVVAFLEVFADILKRNLIPGDGLCTCCGEYIDAGSDYAVILENECVHKVHGNCATMMYKITDFENSNYNKKKKPLIMGAIGAFLGCLIGTVPMVVASFFGGFYPFLGVFIGICAKYGYELFKGKVGGAKIITGFTFGFIGSAFGIFLTIVARVLLHFEEINMTFVDALEFYVHALINTPGTGIGYVLDFGLTALTSFVGAYFPLKKSHEEDKRDMLVVKIFEQSDECTKGEEK